jgi:hypothetical protein
MSWHRSPGSRDSILPIASDGSILSIGSIGPAGSVLAAVIVRRLV